MYLCQGKPPGVPATIESHQCQRLTETNHTTVVYTIFVSRKTPRSSCYNRVSPVLVTDRNKPYHSSLHSICVKENPRSSCYNKVSPVLETDRNKPYHSSLHNICVKENPRSSCYNRVSPVPETDRNKPYHSSLHNICVKENPPEFLLQQSLTSARDRQKQTIPSRQPH